MTSLKFSFAEALPLTYKLNADTNYYQLNSAPLGFNYLPDELQFEETQDKQKIKSNWILRGRIRNGKYLFFTGLKETAHPKILWGDHFSKGKKSFLFSVFSNDNRVMEIYFFRGYYPHNPTLRENNILEFLRVFRNGL